MRKLISIFALLLAASLLLAQDSIVFIRHRAAGGGSPPMFVQTGNCTTGSYACNVVLTITAGNRLLVMMNGNYNGTNSIDDDSTNTFVQAVASHVYMQGNGQAWFVQSAAASGETTFTCTSSTNAYTVQCHVIEISGGTGEVDQANVVNHAYTGDPDIDISAGAVTTTAAAELVFGAFLVNNNNVASWTQHTPYTIPTNGSQMSGNQSSAVAYQSVSSTGEYTPIVIEGIESATIAITVSMK